MRSTFMCRVEPEEDDVETCPKIYESNGLPFASPNPLGYEIIQKEEGSHLRWLEKPSRFLVIHKLNDNRVMDAFYELIKWIVEEDLGDVFVEERTYQDLQNKSILHKGVLHSFVAEEDDLTGKIDFIICLGGDGTLLYASSLFQRHIPPVMAFNFGTLGFLTPFKFLSFRESIPSILHGEPCVVQRSRLMCTISTESGDIITRQGLNEVVIDRGCLPFLSNLDISINGHFVTTVAGDGIIISSPTGSTAYAMAVGASMIHPSVNCMLLAPISPHSLSFRPIVLPLNDVEIKITSTQITRSTRKCSQQGPNVSVDGRSVCILDMKNGSVTIKASPFPVSTICESGEVFNWFRGLAEILHWNARSVNQSYPSTK